jgi:hypothetical protein
LCCRIRPTPLQDKGLRDCCNSERPASSTPKNPFKCLLTVHCALCSQKESKTLKRMCCLQKTKITEDFFSFQDRFCWQLDLGNFWNRSFLV